MNPLMLFLLWPIVEIAGFIVVGREIGVLATIALIFLGGLLGSILLRYQGFGVLRRIQTEVSEGRSPGREVAHGVMILIAGALLLLPGFVSDLVGLALFIPAVRDAAWRFLRTRVNFAEVRMGRGRKPESDRIIDLDAGDYTSSPNPDSPWKGIDKDRR